ncbi:hypothetical protein AB0M02_43815 [Actinoplanes sp. NPDC051861]
MTDEPEFEPPLSPDPPAPPGQEDLVVPDLPLPSPAPAPSDESADEAPD